MKVNRVVLRKVHTPKLLLELNITIDNPDGTSKVIQQYARPESMIMHIHDDNKTITCRINKDAEHYTGSYKMFQDVGLHSFVNATQVLEYTFSRSSLGYTSDGLANSIPGVKLFV